MRPRPAHRLGRPHRARLAAWLAEITGWAELVISPGNLPTSPDLAAGDRGDRSASMQRATDQLHQARMLLERLAADRPQAAPRAGGPVLGWAAEAARHAEHAWTLIQRTCGYAHPGQVDEIATGLTNLTRVLGRLARHLNDADRPTSSTTIHRRAQPMWDRAGPGWDVVVQLAHAHYAVMGCTAGHRAPRRPRRHCRALPGRRHER